MLANPEALRDLCESAEAYTRARSTVVPISRRSSVSDYFSLLVTALTVNGLTRRRGLLSPGQDVSDNDWA